MASKSRVAVVDQVDVHPNAQKLLDTTIELLGDGPIEQVTLAAVLKRSGISNGSLYHHFEDFQDLLEQAIVQRFTQGLKESHAAIKAMLELTDVVEFRKRVEQIILTFHDQNRRPFRMARLETLGALRSRPRLAARIAEAQYNSTMLQAEYLAEFQRRGWFRQDLDMAAISTFMTATFIGRVVDDIASEQIDPDNWSKVALTAFRAILFPD
jgi:AcrR family transcriptional regulator